MFVVYDVSWFLIGPFLKVKSHPAWFSVTGTFPGFIRDKFIPAVIVSGRGCESVSPPDVHALHCNDSDIFRDDYSGNSVPFCHVTVMFFGSIYPEVHFVVTVYLQRQVFLCVKVLISALKSKFCILKFY